MAANRWVLPLVASAGLAGLPACITFHADSPPPDPTPVQPAAGSEFAALPRKPGERVAKREPAAEPTASPPAVEPAVVTDGPAQPTQPATLPFLPPVPQPPPDPPLVAAVRAYLDNRPDLAIECLRALDRPNQELMLQLIPAVVRASQLNLPQAGPHDLAVLQGQLDGAAASLATKAPLLIDRACFCRSVVTFGRYDPLPDQHAFRPGTPAELYVELKNAPSEPVSTADGDGFVTHLVCGLEVRDATGAAVEVPVLGPNKTWQTTPKIRDTKRDFRRSPVRDYFLVFRFPVPTRPGKYTVHVEVTDPANGRSVDRNMPFRVGG